jgi:dTMP kinase
MPSGFFLTFEGLDGSGKSTQLRKLSEWLTAERRGFLATRQPGGTAIGDRIRALLLDSRTGSLDPRTELGLMFSDRAQVIAEVIAPALSQEKIILCDRFTDSTEAYQGGGRRLGSRIVLDLHAAMCGGLQPDLTVLLLPSFDHSLARARARNTRSAMSTRLLAGSESRPSGAGSDIACSPEPGPDENRFEREDEAFYRRVFEKYREIAAREPQRVLAIEGDAGVEKVHTRIVEAVRSRLPGDPQPSLGNK